MKRNHLMMSGCWWLCAAWLWLGLAVPSTEPQEETSEYLTEAEIEQVREAQVIDLRIKVFMKIAERRLLLAEEPQAPSAKKDEADWGRLPPLSQADLLRQYGQAIEEAIINVEEAYDRNPRDERLLKALTIFGEHAARHLQRLESLRPRITEEATRQVLDQVLDDLKLAADDARQSYDQLKAEYEQWKKEQKEQKREKRTG